MLFSSSTFEQKSVFAASNSDVLRQFGWDLLPPILEPFADRFFCQGSFKLWLNADSERAGRWDDDDDDDADDAFSDTKIMPFFTMPGS